jgi:hypothetical protein
MSNFWWSVERTVARRLSFVVMNFALLSFVVMNFALTCSVIVKVLYI